MEARKSILILISGAGGKAKGTGTAGTGLAGAVFCRSFQSDFSNEMEQDRGTGRAGSHGHPVLGSLKSHPCDFSLAFRPFHK